MDFSIGTTPYNNAYMSIGGIGNDGLNVGATNSTNPDDAKKIGGSGNVKPGQECQTCKNRKYQDGSDEMVSFKSAAHISPTAAASAVRGHEQEHVSNAYKKAAQNEGAKVIQASVTLKTAICPECGRAYVAGGVTNTKIAYSNEEQPYQKNLKAFQEEATKGNNVDIKG